VVGRVEKNKRVGKFKFKLENSHMRHFQTPYDVVQDSQSFASNLALYLIGFLFLTVAFGGLMYIAVSSMIFTRDINNEIERIETAQKVLPLLQLLSEKAHANGYAPLNANGLIPAQYIPDLNWTNILNGGCWDAQTNFPALSDGIGIDGMYFVVCTAGTTTLDGNSEWRTYDQLIFNAEVGVWQRIDSSKNIIDNAQTPGSNEAGIMNDVQGPIFSARTLSASGNAMVYNNNLTSNETVIMSASIPLSTNQTITSAGDGESILGTITPSNWEFKTFTASGEANLTSNASGLLLSSSNITGGLRFGYTRITGTITEGYSGQSNGYFTYNIIDGILRLTTYTSATSGFTPGGRFVITWDLTTATDPVVAAVNLAAGQALGLVSGTRTDRMVNACGVCLVTSPPKLIRCVVEADNNANLPDTIPTQMDIVAVMV